MEHIVRNSSRLDARAGRHSKSGDESDAELDVSAACCTTRRRTYGGIEY